MVETTARVDAVDTSRDVSAIDSALARLCSEIPAVVPLQVAEAIRYTCRGGGKRLRGIMVAASYRAAGGTGDAYLLSAAVEMLHAYSLAHDDLPCMDDDDVRRGRPATHRVYGVETTVIAGAVIIPFVAGALARAGGNVWPESTGRAMIAELMGAAGASGMIGGQLADLAAEDAPVGSVGALERIHRCKTGALIAACCRAAGMAAGASDASIRALGEYGSDVGLAFQIVDDVLDVTSTSAQLGKTAGRDAALGKSTYPGLLGVEGAMSRAHNLVREGCNVLAQAGLLTTELRHLADLVITRTH
ncbi:MAG: polyprenyl synthetase family protein [Gemmatimonadaceae bacterium]